MTTGLGVCGEDRSIRVFSRPESSQAAGPHQIFPVHSPEEGLNFGTKREHIVGLTSVLEPGCMNAQSARPTPAPSEEHRNSMWDSEQHGFPVRGRDLDPLKWVAYPLLMEPVQFSDALRLTELSESQLREWCGKRGLFQPTVPARGPGRIALYSWQDLIALRVFREIFQVFGGRASSWAIGIGELRLCLAGQFFPNLWGRCAIFPDQRSAYLGLLSMLPSTRAALFVPLDPHLAVISCRATPEELQGQLQLVTKVRSSQ